ncbi:restriction endonuclease subunit S [Neobacillus sp. PS3-12]|uniref:restriction endonuclease subunit S n=1 Tax=Neobacillus sp. PS3-12 TaxID=3070677 RepID=UPI0027E0C3D1|nr:restriction endonuclease subunit S [Neobacillus sp. PS3-12]WML51708.1 restriction endonuclease subunit S [Neobacillus sp. PS3-12]
MIFTDLIELNPTIPFEKGKEYPFIEMANVDTYSRSPKAVETKRYSSGVKFQKGDTVIARIEPCLQNGKGFFVNELTCGFGSTEFLVFRPKSEDVDNRFLYYFLQTDYIRKSMIASMTGATGRQRVNNKIFDSLDITIPDISTQCRIADILSSYDDLIENKQKQIKLLEEAAMGLYKEWFVKLRFPGYETTIIKDGIPDGWKKLPLSEISSFKYGKMPKKEKIRDKGFPVYSGYRIVGYYDEFMFENEMLIVIARGVGGTGDVKLSPKYCYLTNLSIAFLLNEETYKYYLFQCFNHKNLRELDTGAAQSQITIDNLSRFKVLIPSDDLLIEFNGFIFPIRSKIDILEQQIKKLTEARDKLLPRLMSGEIEV